jgi:hypothetical protein
MDGVAPEDAKYVRADGLEVNRMPDGYVVYQPERDKVHYLNPSAAMIFELCGEKTTFGAITTYLQEAYALSAPPVGEVRACLAELVAEGIIRPC